MLSWSNNPKVSAKSDAKIDVRLDCRSEVTVHGLGLRRKVPASQLPQGQSIRRLDFAHPMRNRITNFGDAKKNLGNMQLSRAV
jgi:hypothetical protein